MADGAPGWYRDPENAFRLRFWNGRSWTEHVRVREGAAQTDAYGPAHPVTPGLVAPAPHETVVGTTAAALDLPAAVAPRFVLSAEDLPPAPVSRFEGVGNPVAYLAAVLAIVGAIWLPIGLPSVAAILMAAATAPRALAAARRGERFSGLVAVAVATGIGVYGVAAVLMQASATSGSTG